MKQRSGFAVMARLVGLVRPLVGYMLLAIAMGLLGHACAALITVFGGYALLELLLQLGSDGKLLAPKHLKERLVCECEQMLAQYTSPDESMI